MKKEFETYYTLVRSYGTTHFAIMKVTSEKHIQVYGSIDGMPTHKRKDTCKGKFYTLSEVQDCKKQIIKIINKYRIEYKRLNEEMNSFHASEYAEIEALINKEYSV